MAGDIYDLRSFIQRLEEEGELSRVKVEVDWKYELGAITRRVLSQPPFRAMDKRTLTCYLQREHAASVVSRIYLDV